jgi:UDP-glucose 4,6-dehydratase
MGSGAAEQPAQPSPAGQDEHTPRNILLTGGAGFIGAHVVAALHARFPQYKVVVLDKLDYCASYENVAALEGSANFRWCRGDIRSKCLVDHLLRSEDIDTILHFAASTHVDNSFNSSISFTSNNVVGTHVLLESAREYGKIERFIHVSTDEVYGGETNGETEESMLLPTNPYACTKAAAELICNGYAASFGLPIVMTRGNNVYGPLQYPDKYIAKACCLLARGKKIFIHGDGSNLRNYVYVTDMADAFVIILHRGKTGSVYNVGSDTEKSNLEVARDLVTVCGKGRDVDAHIQFVVDREMNDRRYHIDSTKLRALGWRPAVSWEEGLRRTAEWYANKSNLKRWKNIEGGLVAHPVMPTGPTDEYIL